MGAKCKYFNKTIHLLTQEQGLFSFNPLSHDKEDGGVRALDRAKLVLSSERGEPVEYAVDDVVSERGITAGAVVTMQSRPVCAVQQHGTVAVPD